MNNPAITVIIPVYNAQEGLKQCLDSLLNQTFRDFEIILLNDGSTDDSLLVLQTYASAHNFIRVIDKKTRELLKREIKEYTWLRVSILSLLIMMTLLILII